MSDLKEMLVNLDLSIRAQAAIENPNHAFLGDSVAGAALKRIEELENQMKINEVEVQRLNLQPGEVLVVKIKSDAIGHSDMDQLASQFRKLIPNNKVAVLAVGEQDNIDLTIAKGSEYPDVKQASPCSVANYCNDCSCGKKEIAEALKKG